MKIVSWNVNGLRAISSRNFLEWFIKTDADIICLQEIKAQEKQIPESLLAPRGYRAYFNCGRKKGYAGVAVYTKEKPLWVKDLLGLKRFDGEGRILILDFSGFKVVNLYLPHGGRKKENLGYKIKVYDRLISYLKKVKGERVILVGDFNVAHTELDLARPKQNKNNIMFTKEERDRLDKILSLGFIDTFRQFQPEGGQFTWWPYYANAINRNLGWRLDYIFISAALAVNLKKAFISSEVTGSDHCPVGIKI